MKLTMDKTGIKKVEKDIESAYSNIINLYSKLIEKYNNVTYYWQGEDAKTFVSKVTEYIENEKNSLQNIKNLSAILNKSVSFVEKEENRFASEAKGGNIYE